MYFVFNLFTIVIHHYMYGYFSIGLMGMALSASHIKLG